MKTETQMLRIPDVILFHSRRLDDTRGYFSETYRASWFVELNHSPDFVQDNQVGSTNAGTIRGLHFQAPPQAQAKLVRVLRGAIFDVAVDLRVGSSTFGEWVGATLTTAGEQLFIPRGFAHGYCTLQANTEVAYKCDDYYAPETEGGVIFSDRDVGIQWPVAAGVPTVSEKDQQLPALSEFISPFRIEDFG